MSNYAEDDCSRSHSKIGVVALVHEVGMEFPRLHGKKRAERRVGGWKAVTVEECGVDLLTRDMRMVDVIPLV